ncbi:uncharacterized protein LOC131845535 [Achroia grisella]|uniref:uncharacterized protein LOC131845535 n=1 Tax=Achroia grisella TaxID=688607 RepID=UPI0027D26812|nr:uncharacterized protein LOC131845535 [Achroia grisella]XP_059050587.1 uncharacterized protein LOC131845535 [Achroia grisella]
MDDVTIPPTQDTPDYRVEQQLLPSRSLYYTEEHRPFRISPAHKQLSQWWGKDQAYWMGCYCTTVFKRLRLLSGCAVITTRHAITTATATELILRKRRHFRTFENILGIWYDQNGDTFNSSLYATPAQIHYHPRYTRPKDVNRSHPFPIMFDISLWTMTYRFFGSFWTISKTYICNRASSHKWEYAPATFREGEMTHVIGFQYIRAYKRKPMPWFKYVVRTRSHVVPCPKLEWGWYLCVPGYWAPLGVESGAAVHRVGEHKSWRYDGLLGLAVISMKLRSLGLIHYFGVLDSHPVLDFLYDAYMGKAKYEWLDVRFYQDRERKEVALKKGYNIPWNYDFGEEKYYGHHISNH